MQPDTSSSSRHLKNAPIQEAVLHIRSGLDRSNPENGRAIPFRPAVEELEKQGLSFDRYIYLQEQFPPFVAVPKENNMIVGHRFTTEDRKWILQWFADGGVSLSRLSPYESWGAFAAFARTVFQLVISENEVSETRTIGLRFINRFPIANPDDLFKKYFKNPGDSPGVKSFVRNGFVSFNKFEIPNENKTLSVSKNLLEQVVDGRHSLFAILDIDVVAAPRGIESWTDILSS